MIKVIKWFFSGKEICDDNIFMAITILLTVGIGVGGYIVYLLIENYITV